MNCSVYKCLLGASTESTTSMAESRAAWNGAGSGISQNGARDDYGSSHFVAVIRHTRGQLSPAAPTDAEHPDIGPMDGAIHTGERAW